MFIEMKKLVEISKIIPVELEIYLCPIFVIYLLEAEGSDNRLSTNKQQGDFPLNYDIA